MTSNPFSLPSTRREFLCQAASGAGLLAFGGVAPAFLAQSVRAGVPTAEADRPILVLIQLAGGNDGLNTVVPFADDRYHKLRPQLALPQRDLHRLDGQRAFHPAMAEMAALFRDGKLGIVQNVGYPNPNRSHFRSMEIWETAAASDELLSTGWVGRYFDNCCGGSPAVDPRGVAIGNEMPDVFNAAREHLIFSLSSRGRRDRTASSKVLLQALENTRPNAPPPGGNDHFLRHVLMDTLVTEERLGNRLRDYRAYADYPQSALAQNLRQVAALIASGQRTRVYFVSHGGFDTHVQQLPRHHRLLAELSAAMAAFQADLAGHRLEDQVLTLTFSEFGRRPAENRSGGTDHGTAAPLFVMGSRVRGQVCGTAPDLEVGKNRDLAYTTDFRAVYATLVERWLGGDSRAILGRSFDPVPFL